MEPNRLRHGHTRYGQKSSQVNLKTACELEKMPYHTVWQRLNRLGWDVARALYQPVRIHRSH